MTRRTTRQKGRRGPHPRILTKFFLLMALAGAVACTGGEEEDGAEGPQQAGGSSDWDQMVWDQDDWS